MAKKSGIEHIASAAQTAKALKDIIKAFMQGGWQAAAMQVLKHYWPQILAVALVLILLPVIIFCCLPAMLFGFGGSTDSTVSAINVQASAVSSYYDKYEEYCNIRIEEIKTSIINGNSKNNDSTHQSERDVKTITCEIVITGNAMEKNWLIALHSVSISNNLNAMDEQSVKDFVKKSIVYTVKDNPHEMKTESCESNTNTNTKILTIRYLTPLEFMTEYGYSETDRNWAQLMYRTLQDKDTPIGEALRTPFPKTQ